MSDLAGFLEEAVAWATSTPGLRAVGLAGSLARGTATPTSDVDLIVIVAALQPWLGSTDWVGRFGEHVRVADEDLGLVQSRRVHYAAGPEVEFGFTTKEWTSSPLDHGTAEVIRDGFRVLYDPEGLLAHAVAEATQTRDDVTTGFDRHRRIR